MSCVVVSGRVRILCQKDGAHVCNVVFATARTNASYRALLFLTVSAPCPAYENFFRRLRASAATYHTSNIAFLNSISQHGFLCLISYCSWASSIMSMVLKPNRCLRSLTRAKPMIPPQVTSSVPAPWTRLVPKAAGATIHPCH